MPTLTTEQNAVWKADIEATVPDLVAAHDYFSIRDVYNAIAVPDYIVWRTRVNQDEIMQNGFDWVRVDNLSVGKARIWEWLFANAERIINPSKANVRLGIDETWKGTAADLLVREAVYVHCKRPATVLEKLFATGTGTTLSPSVMSVEGMAHYEDVKTAMGW